MASTPLSPPPAPRAPSERDARTQRRLDAARATRARRRLTAPTPPTLRARVATHRHRRSAYLHRNRTEISVAIQMALCAIVIVPLIGLLVATLLVLAPVTIPLLLLVILISPLFARAGREPDPSTHKRPRQSR